MRASLAEWRAVLRQLETPAREGLLNALGVGEADAPALLADPAWARATVQALSAPARHLLGLLVRLPLGAYVQDLEQALELTTPPGLPRTPSSPIEQLVGAGVVVVHRERTLRRGRAERVTILQPLRERWAAQLDQQEADEGAGPMRVSPQLDLHVQHRAAFELGVALAAIAHLRPRVTRGGEIHQRDLRALTALVEPLWNDAGLAGQRLEALARSPWTTVQDDRLDVDDSHLDAIDPLNELLRLHVSDRLHRSGYMAAVGLLLDTGGWCARHRLLEPAVITLLREWPMDLTAQADEVLRDLLATPGVLQQEHEGQLFVSLAPCARAVFEGDATPAPDATPELLVQPDHRILAQPGVPPATLVALGRWARLERADRVATFVLDPACVRRTVAEGGDIGALLSRLEAGARMGVPSNVARALSDWSRRRGRARVVVGAVLLADLAEDEVRRITRADVEALAPGVFRIEERQVRAMIHALRGAGVSCLAPGAPLDVDVPEDLPYAPPADAATLAREARRRLVATRQLSGPR